MGKIEKDEQGQTNLNTNPDNEVVREINPVFMRV